MIPRSRNVVRIRLDASNPGQFFACCGLLELADRLWRDAEGWFDGEGFAFSTAGSLEEVLQSLVHQPAVEVTELGNGVSVAPLIAPLDVTLRSDPRLVMRLDAWMTVHAERDGATAKANEPWNFWSGQQTSLRIWTALRTALLEQLKGRGKVLSEHVLFQRCPLSGRFGFDPGAAWNSLDAGFSPNEQKIEVASSPVVEMLAAVGIQRFRPRVSDNRKTFVYSSWGRPLSPTVAAAAMTGLVAVLPRVRFLGRVVSRGSYAALGFSTPIKGADHE